MSHAKASHQDHEDHAHEGPEEDDHQAHEDHAHEGPEGQEVQANEGHAHEEPQGHEDPADEGHENHEGPSHEDPTQERRPTHGCAMEWAHPVRQCWMQELDLREKEPVVCQVHPLQPTMGEFTPTKRHHHARPPAFTK